MSPITLRLRECGLTSPRNRFAALLNLRCIAFRRELKDRHLKYDEMIAPRKEAFQRWWDTQFPQHSELSMHEIYELYDAAYAKVRAATLRKKARIHKLATMLALVKDALKKQR
jgi:hypothetical protein